MARSESRTKTAIWSDADFQGLTESAQRAYWMLYSQPTISLCGVVALTVRRWASYASDSTPDGIMAALAELEEAGYIICDMDTEELFVRSFARHDGIQKNSKVWIGAWRQLDAISSQRIAHAAREELARIGHPPADLGTQDAPSHRASIPHPPVDNQLQDAPCDTPSDTPSSFDPPSLRLQSPSPATSLPAVPAVGTGATHGTGTTSFVGLRDLIGRISDVCTGTNRQAVLKEASALVTWAVTDVDKRLVEEAILWASSQTKPPVMPRALAPVIVGKARDAKISMRPFRPDRESA